MVSEPSTASNGGEATELMQRALTFHKEGTLDEAARLYQTILGMDAGHFEARHMLGAVMLQRGQFDEAIVLISGALQTRPDSFHALCDAGFAFLLAHRMDEAVQHYGKALAIQSDDIDARFQRGKALAALGRFDEALTDYDRSIALKPDFADALANRGKAALALNRVDEAIANLERALVIRPDFVEALHDLGRALTAQQRYDEAIVCFDGVLEFHPNAYDALNDRGNAFRAMGRHDAAIASYAAQLLCATSFMRTEHSKVRPKVSSRGQRVHDRIRLGYLSGNFHDHAATYLISELFESHDRTRFEITAFSFGPESRGVTRLLPRASPDRFIDVRAMSDADVATLLRDLEIDIAIDMMGHTLDARIDIFAYCPAPIQVNYLGYTGTTGASFVDYIIADH